MRGRDDFFFPRVVLLFWRKQKMIIIKEKKTVMITCRVVTHLTTFLLLVWLPLALFDLNRISKRKGDKVNLWRYVWRCNVSYKVKSRLKVASVSVGKTNKKKGKTSYQNINNSRTWFHRFFDVRIGFSVIHHDYSLYDRQRGGFWGDGWTRHLYPSI